MMSYLDIYSLRKKNANKAVTIGFVQNKTAAYDNAISEIDVNNKH